MATITLQYDARNASVKKALELLFTLGVTEEKKENAVTPNAKTETSINNVLAGKNLSKPYTNTQSLFNDLKI